MEELDRHHKEMYAHLNLSREDVDGFGRGAVIGGAVSNLEDRCSVYAIVGASALRMGVGGVIPPPDPTTKTRRSKPSKEEAEDSQEVTGTQIPGGKRSPRRFTSMRKMSAAISKVNSPPNKYTSFN